MHQRSRKPSLHTRLALLLIIALFGSLFSIPHADASSARQDDPAAACQKGLELLNNGDFINGRQYVEEGFAGRDGAYFPDPDLLGWCAYAVGISYEIEQDYTTALGAYAVAQATFQQTLNRDAEAATLEHIGIIYHHQGRYAEALDIQNRVLEFANLAHDQQGQVSGLINISLLYLIRNRFDESETYAQQAYAIVKQLSGQEAAEGRILQILGAVDSARDNYDDAVTNYKQAIQVHQRGNDIGGLIPAFAGLGHVYENYQQYELALDAYLTALKLIEDQGGQDDGERLYSTGALYRKLGNYEAATPYLDRALPILQQIGNRRIEGMVYYNYGLIADAQGHSSEAAEQFEKAVALLEEVRAVAGDELGRSSFIAQFAEVYASAVQHYVAQGQLEEAFRISERGRARAFLDSLVTSYVQLADDDAQKLLADEQDAYIARQAAREALAGARIANPSDAQRIATLDQQLADAEQTYSDALRAITDRSDQLAALVPGRSSSVLGVAEVQALLASDMTLVSYFVGEEQTLVFILTHDQFKAKQLDIKQSELDQQVTNLLGFADTNVAIPPNARDLYGELIAPIKADLTAPHLIIVPHNVLHYLPFAALSDGQRFLIDDYTLSVLPSASSLPFIQQNAEGRTPTAPLILGNPATDAPDLKPLRYAESEARAVAGLYATALYVGPQASEPVLIAQASQAGIVHLAAHGEYNSVAPLSSVIYLAPEGDSEPFDPARDGRLEVGEIYGLDLHQADLVVLSACETQLGELSAGDELVGMTRAFFFAGTPSVIATLWSVDDQTTGDLMQRFYTHLRTGKSKAEALRLAQQEIRKDHPSPYYWAGFVLSGHPGEPRAMPIWPWLAGGGLLLALALVGGGALIWRRSRKKQVRPLTAVGEE